MSIYIILNYVIGAYALFLIIAGTFGNLFTVFIITSTKLKETTTFIFFAFLAVTDALSLYFWNLDHFLVGIFGIDRQNTSAIWCKVDSFIQFVVLQSSAYFLVEFFMIKNII